MSNLQQPQDSASGPVPPSQAGAKRKRRLIVGGAAVALALVGVGVAYALGAFTRGGPQPASIISADASIYASIDLNAAPAQQLLAAQYLVRFPAFRDAKDPAAVKRILFDGLMPNLTTEPSVDYDTKVKPWLGDRFAVATVSIPGSLMTPVMVFEVTDQAQASQSLEVINATGRVHCRFIGTFVGCTTQRDALESVTVTDRGRSLEASTPFAGDLASVDGSGVGRFWVDTDKVPHSAGPAVLITPLQGRLAAGIRFTDARTLEVQGIIRGQASVNTATGTQADKLAADTVVAVSINGGADRVTAEWPAYAATQTPEDLSRWEAWANLKVPDELAALVGQHTSLGVLFPPTIRSPLVAVVTDGDRAVAERVTPPNMPPGQVHTVDGQVVLADSPEIAQAVVSGGLAGTPGFLAALPEANIATFLAYADLASLIAAYERNGDMDLSAVHPLQSFGLAVTGSGSDRFTARVILKG